MLLVRLLKMRGAPLRWSLLYAWHPLVVIEVAGQGHLDGIWTTALACALVAVARGARDGGSGWLVLGAGVRLYPIALLAVWVRAIGSRRVARGLLVASPLLLLAIPLAMPGALERVAGVVGRFTNYYEFNGGFYYGVKWLIDAAAIAPSNRIAGAIGIFVQLLAIAGAALLTRRDASLARVIAASLIVTTAVIALGAKSHPWYYAAPLLLAATDPARPLARAWLWIALVAPLTYIAYTVAPVDEPAWVLWVEWGGAVVVGVSAWFRERRASGKLE